MTTPGATPRILCIAGAVLMSACASSTVRLASPPTAEQSARFNQQAAQLGTATLIDGTKLQGSEWRMDATSLLFTDALGTAQSRLLRNVERVEFPKPMGQAVGKGMLRGALIGGVIGTLLGLALSTSEASCSPQPCTPPDLDGSPDDIWAGGLAGVVVGSISGGVTTLMTGGRTRFIFQWVP